MKFTRDSEETAKCKRGTAKAKTRHGLQLLYICHRFVIHAICAYDHVATVTEGPCLSFI